MTPRRAPYGSWTSPITAESIARESISLAEPWIAGDAIWWIESRPSEGRDVIVRTQLDRSDRLDAIPAEFSARTRVHEYGGGAYTVVGDSVVFSGDADGRVYRARPGEQPAPLTPEPARPRSLRYADFAAAGERIFAVRESHERGGQAVNEIVAFDLEEPGEPDVIASGRDFYAAPRPGPGGALAWLAWDHPLMPWDGCELWVDGAQVAGGPEESIAQPAWSPDGRLHWISDRSGWWNLYREDGALHPAEAEFAMPQWVFGLQSYAFLDDGRIACVWSSDGFPHLGLLDSDSHALDELGPQRLPTLRSVRIVSDGGRLAYVGASPTHSPALVLLDAPGGQARVIAQSAAHEPNAGYVSRPRPIAFASGERTAHALFYAPRNKDFEGADDETPPLLVISHGGPTAQAEPALELKTQYWTSRGFAVVDVNYGGSTGYGRAYRNLLRGNWGVVDVEDCVAAAQHLAEQDAVDAARLAIRGSSAGGYTTLCALAFTDVFHAGASYYGIADMVGFGDETHKFESHYDEGLIPAQKARERSPIYYVRQISAPVIVFQGLEDAIVVPAQAELIVAALRSNGIDHEYHAYAGEAHGFRGAQTIIDSLEAELGFYLRVFGIAGAPVGASPGDRQ